MSTFGFMRSFPHPRAPVPTRTGAAVVLAALLTSLSAAAAPELSGPPLRPVHSLSLLPGVEAEFGAAGDLFLVDEAGNRSLLTAAVITPVSEHWRRPRLRRQTPFFALTAEGAPGGLRGFSAGADDDGDGAVDEDPLDGIDNDGDGAVDEDFAAIGDRMLAFRQMREGLGIAREFYHWSGPGLKSVLFLNPRVENAEPGAARLRLEGREPWSTVRVSANHHAGDGQIVPSSGTIHVARVSVEERETGAARDLWLGAIRLDGAIMGEAGAAAIAAETPYRLDLTIGADAGPVALCVAESWLQLKTTLLEARQVRNGLTDPVSGRSAPWIAPASCAPCRLGEAPLFLWERPAADRLAFWAEIRKDQTAAMDPDLFSIGGVRLGSPTRIVWTDAEGNLTVLPWGELPLAAMQTGTASDPDPFLALPDLMRHGGTGVLELEFDSPPWAAIDHLLYGKSVGEDGRLAGAWIDGRSLSAAVRPAPAPRPTRERGDQGPDLTLANLLADPGRLTLAPDLLLGWPNPFRDQIQIRFRVPATVQEAFAWDDDEGVPPELDLQAAIPWSGGQPQVTVKIYGINGQEIRTLHSGRQGPGELTAYWDGTDSHGRPLASGTYFCNLQLDELSLTRRLVYIR